MPSEDDHDPCYLALGAKEADRRERYKTFLRAAIPAGELESHPPGSTAQPTTGTDRFVQKVELIPGKTIENRSRVRPSKSTQATHGWRVKWLCSVFDRSGEYDAGAIGSGGFGSEEIDAGSNVGGG